MADEQVKVISSRMVYAGKLFDLLVDEIELPGGVRAAREHVRHPGAVCMIPIDSDGSVLMVKQYRHPAGERLLELPAGTREPGEEPEDTARRELAEEVGRTPGRVHHLGGFYVAPGYTSEYIDLFVCENLVEANEPGEEDEDIEIIRMAPEAALKAIEDGEIKDAKSIVGLLRWIRWRS